MAMRIQVSAHTCLCAPAYELFPYEDLIVSFDFQVGYEACVLKESSNTIPVAPPQVSHGTTGVPAIGSDWTVITIVQPQVFQDNPRPAADASFLSDSSSSADSTTSLPIIEKDKEALYERNNSNGSADGFYESSTEMAAWIMGELSWTRTPFMRPVLFQLCGARDCAARTRGNKRGRG